MIQHCGALSWFENDVVDHAAASGIAAVQFERPSEALFIIGGPGDALAALPVFRRVFDFDHGRTIPALLLI